jgi:hypothetical protein
MGWKRVRADVERKRPRHARVPLNVNRCGECHTLLPHTYQFGLLSGLCWSCFRTSFERRGRVLSVEEVVCQ